MTQQKATGLILKSKAIFERDKVLEVFSPVLGRITLRARGANSSQSKHGGRLDFANYIQFGFSKTGEYKILTHCDLLCNFPKIRTDFNCLSLLFYFCEIVRKATIYHQQNQALFVLLLETIQLLEDFSGRAIASAKPAEAYQTLKNTFYNKLLNLEGLLTNHNLVHNDVEFKMRFEDYVGSYLVQPVLLK